MRCSRARGSVRRMAVAIPRTITRNVIFCNTVLCVNLEFILNQLWQLQKYEYELFLLSKSPPLPIYLIGKIPIDHGGVRSKEGLSSSRSLHSGLNLLPNRVVKALYLVAKHLTIKLNGTLFHLFCFMAARFSSSFATRPLNSIFSSCRPSQMSWISHKLSIVDMQPV